LAISYTDLTFCVHVHQQDLKINMKIDSGKTTRIDLNIIIFGHKYFTYFDET